MKLLTVAAMAFTLLAGSVNAAEQLNAYSIMPEKYASKVFAEFTKDTGIKVNFMRFSSGEALARLNAEKKNPQVDVMLGGPADTYAAGVKEGIFEQYRPKDSDAIPANLRDPQNHMAIPAVVPNVIPAMVPAAVVAPLTLVFAALSRYSAAFRSRDIFLNCGDSKLSMVAY